MSRRGVIVVLVIVGIALAAAAAGVWLRARGSAGGVSVDDTGDRVQTVGRGSLPLFATAQDTGALYAFAPEHGDVPKGMPCTCGCADLGHASSRACFLKAETAEIRRVVDARYVNAGTPVRTPRP